MDSVCMKCGAAKKHFDDMCPTCAHKPENHPDLLLSLYLSKARFSDWEEGTSYEAFLFKCAQSIEQGESVVIPEELLEELQRYVDRYQRRWPWWEWAKVLLILAALGGVGVGGIWLLVMALSQ